MFSYDHLQENEAILHVRGDKFIPPGYHGSEFAIIPDDVVAACIERFKLCDSNVAVLDPMCGAGTIPRVINQHGGNCIGVEIDEDIFASATAVNKPGIIRHGDFTGVRLVPRQFDVIFTSMPFTWFKDPPPMLTDRYAKRLRDIMTPNGTILIDSVQHVDKPGESWDVAPNQVRYFEANGFQLTSITKFIAATSTDAVEESLLLQFQNFAEV